MFTTSKRDNRIYLTHHSSNDVDIAYRDCSPRQLFSDMLVRFLPYDTSCPLLLYITGHICASYVIALYHLITA